MRLIAYYCLFSLLFTFSINAFADIASGIIAFEHFLPDEKIRKYKLEIDPLTSESKKESCSSKIMDIASNYPNDFLAEHLDSIILLDSIKLQNVTASGLYIKLKHNGRSHYKTIYLSCSSNADKVARIFHHEFSSIILKYKLNNKNKNRWKSISENNYCAENKMSGNFCPGYKKNYDRKIIKNLNEFGIITHYGNTSLENDFNIYAEFVFARPEALYRLTQEYSTIKDKLKIFLETYKKAGFDIQRDFFDFNI